MADITAAGLISRYPEWAKANTSNPDVVAEAVNHANSLSLSLYIDSDQERRRRELEAGSWLFEHPYSRNIAKGQGEQINFYRRQANRMDRNIATLHRAPGWPAISGVS